MNIAIIGHGRIGAGLARAWAGIHQVSFAARDPKDAKLLALCKEIGATAASIGAATDAAEVTVLAVPHAAVEGVLDATGGLAGTIVIDCTNAVGKGMALTYGHTDSAAEVLQRKIPQAKVFKSFNAQGAENLAKPSYQGVAASNFYCGDDDDARKIVGRLVADVGFDAVDAGPLKNARLLEPLMLLWVAASRSLGTRDVAFRLMRRER